MRPLELDPEIREAVRDLPDFVFSTDTVPMMRQNAPFPPVPAPDIERIDLTTDPNGGVSLTLLRPSGATGDLPGPVLDAWWRDGDGKPLYGQRPSQRMVPLAVLRLRQRRIPVGTGSAISAAAGRLRQRTAVHR